MGNATRIAFENNIETFLRDHAVTGSCSRGRARRVCCPNGGEDSQKRLFKTAMRRDPESGALSIEQLNDAFLRSADLDGRVQNLQQTLVDGAVRLHGTAADFLNPGHGFQIGRELPLEFLLLLLQASRARCRP